ncbi:MAG: SpoIID/LytB domain-containing protein [Clostridia bacterium]|nr:SpoIID/LytB domain-containing protein [Clostridia bacterium]
MKGYGVLSVLVMGILLLLPSVFVASPPETGQAALPETPPKTAFTVAHSDGTTVSEIAAYDLTLYETMATVAPDAPDEAIKAQAVVCYTAFCYQRHTKEEGKADVATTALPFPEAYSEAYWQERWGAQYETNAQRFRAAVSAVEGQRLLCDGNPIMAVHHAMNSGQTESAAVLFGQEIPYLRPVSSAADALSVDQLSTVSIPVEEVKPILSALVTAEAVGEPSTWFGEAVCTEAGTVTTITVCGKSVSGQQIMQAFSLPSAAFAVQVQDGAVIFTVHGRGHFVGLSVYGAAAMAEDGATYDTILKHYYTGAELKI